MNSPLFVITFEDKKVFVGGTSYKKTKWLEVPQKKIKSVFYRLPSGDHLGLSGYDNYYYMIEATQDLNGINKGNERLQAFYAMGKKDDKVLIYRVNLRNHEISTTLLDSNDKAITGLNKAGWR